MSERQRAHRVARIVALRAQGLSEDAVARAVGVSRARVYQLAGKKGYHTGPTTGVSRAQVTALALRHGESADLLYRAILAAHLAPKSCRAAQANGWLNGL